MGLTNSDFNSGVGTRVGGAWATRSVTIPSGGGSTATIDLAGYALIMLHMPTAWTAADINIEAAPEPDGTFQDVYDDAGTLVALTVAANRSIGIDAVAGVIAPARFIRLKASVNQAADRTITLILKR